MLIDVSQKYLNQGQQKITLAEVGQKLPQSMSTKNNLTEIGKK